jgi:tRNA(fMet)-specific endonuclease VapC
VLVLDTDHLTEIDRGSPAGVLLMERLEASSQDVVTTIVSAEEQLRGWLAQINRIRDPRRQIDAYARLQGRIAFFAEWTLLPFDAAAAEQFVTLRQQGIRIATMDLKIGAIVTVQNATLLSRNLGDFAKLSALRIENWL